MSSAPHIEALKNHYIHLSKMFFGEIAGGKKPEDLLPLREELDKTLLELDRLEKQEDESQPGH